MFARRPGDMARIGRLRKQGAGISMRVTEEPDWERHAQTADMSLEDLKEAAAREVVRDAKRRAPVQEGDLQSSIRAEGPDSDGDWLVGSNIFYSVFQEFGTVHQPAQPYLRPAVDAIRTRLHALARGKILGVSGKIRAQGGGV